MVLMEPECTYREGETLCAIVTWSDWDMGVCLNHECNRKQIKKAAFFNQWIDIRALYRVSTKQLVHSPHSPGVHVIRV